MYQCGSSFCYASLKTYIIATNEIHKHSESLFLIYQALSARHLQSVDGDKQGIFSVRHLLTVDGDKQGHTLCKTSVNCGWG